jgi:hypothetical protein
MASNTTYKLFADKMGGTAANAFIGQVGEIFYDTDGTSPLRLSDGRTRGGIPFTILSVSNNFNPQFTANGNVIANLISSGTYIKQGLITYVRCYVDFANVAPAAFTDIGQYQIVLPLPSSATITLRGGTLHQTNGNSRYHIAGIVDISESNTIMKLYYSGGTTDLAWKNNTPVLATSNTTHFDLSGAYETVA